MAGICSPGWQLILQSSDFIIKVDDIAMADASAIMLDIMAFQVPPLLRPRFIRWVLNADKRSFIGGVVNDLSNGRFPDLELYLVASSSFISFKKRNSAPDGHWHFVAFAHRWASVMQTST